MEGGKICGSSNMNALIHSEQLSCSSEVMESLWIPSSTSALRGNFVFLSASIFFSVAASFVFESYYLSCSLLLIFFLIVVYLNFSNGFCLVACWRPFLCQSWTVLVFHVA